MKTAVAETSIDSYHALRREGGLTRQQHKVLAVIRPYRDYSLQELVIASGLPVNVISGRVNELKTEKRLEHGPTRKCSITGRTVHPVRLPAEPAQGGLFA